MSSKVIYSAVAAVALIAAIGIAVVYQTVRVNSFGVEAVALEPMSLNPSSLTVAGPNGVFEFSGADLEALGAHRVTTTTPWRETPAVFEGVLLTEVLAIAGLENTAKIRVVAENDYAVELPRSVWTERPLLIATRVDGAPHERANRGPLQFVFPMNADRTTARSDFEGNWVWMAARIEAAE